MTTDCKSLLSFVILLLIASPIARAQTPPPPEYLDQGRSESQRQSWYLTSQGSRLLPLAWFLALELPGSNEKIVAPSNMRRYGYLASYSAGATLPIGFAVDTGLSPDRSTSSWVGMTCAACHTAEVTYQGKLLRVDGAPTLADFETFFDDLVAALKATNEEQVKFEKFAVDVLGSQLAAGKAQLKAELQVQADWYATLAAKNRSSVRYGHGRLDAQGHILNKISLIVGAQQQLSGFTSNAPASYPFLWYTPKQEKAQWNGLVEQPGVADLGILARNIGQVIGVFASVDVASNQTKYPSSVRKANLEALENLVKELKPPKWPETILPKLGSLKDGKELFELHCAECHNSVDRATGNPIEPKRPLARMEPLAKIGTDIWLACNTFRHTSNSGLLEGRKVRVLLDDDPPHGPILHTDKTSFMLKNMIIGAFLGFPPPPAGPPDTSALQEVQVKQFLLGSRDRTALNIDAPKIAFAPLDQNLTSADRTAPIMDGSKIDSAPLDQNLTSEGECRDASKQGDMTLAYKGGPLHGIWATAPYLHNGSVPTLADLLLPANRRPTSFRVGGTEFDPDSVGFKSDSQDGPFEFRVRDASGKIIPGNDNAGHEFGTSLLETQRKALLEYLKSL